ncbi:hypothetical protein IAR55_002265 [Kwoniella newhampshirensis]|uniref:ATP-dependent helicase n=1 Tax=Kwoniella newhampshirensis TaxID=1651941 RepID=A0AAW0Z0U4_9TREE
MSSAEAERKRRDALNALKARKQGKSITPQPTSDRSSPDPSTVLIPASSSPAGPDFSNRSRYLAAGTNGHGTSGVVNGTKLTYGGGAPAVPGVIPSSGIGRKMENGHGQGQAFTGSPQDVLKALHSRHASSNDQPSTSTTAPRVASLVDLSPSSPQPPSRLKARYADPDEADPPTPTKRTSFAPSSPSSSSSVSRQPSLVLAARSQQDEQEDLLASRLQAQFSNVPRTQIVSLLRKFPGNPDRAINQIQYIDSIRGEQPSPVASPSSYRSSVPTSAPQFVPSKPKLPGQIRPIIVQRPSQPPPAPVVVRPRAPPKPKKNEKSSIYANRASNGKRRDPDESESANEASDGESDGSWSGDEGRKRKRRKGDPEVDAEGEALRAFNEVDADMLTGTIACSVEQAATVIRLRPFADVEDCRHKLNKARGVSVKLFEQYTEIMEGYVQIDACLNRCEAIASDVANTLAVWRGASEAQDTSVIGTPRSDGLNDVKVDVAKVSELLRNETDMKKRKILSSYIQSQPATLSKGTVLKDYQLLGINWLNLLYSKKIGCILADEMGLGKTIQVIAFIAALKERGIKGPHMIFVPFAPGIDVQTYYGSQAERASLRDDLKKMFRSGKLEVVLASYTQVAASDDLSFFRKKIDFETCIYDEGHRLKSCTTKAYSDLLSIKPRWRLLLTGTPLQNNLQELVSLLMFIHKDTFTDAEPYLRAIFKSQGHANLLSQQRTSRARAMLTPFVLRRRKAHVLDLPPKLERVEECDMTKVQAKLYNETMQKSKKVLAEMSDDVLDAAAADDEVANQRKPGAKKPAKGKKVQPVGGNSSNILMDLRKAASHPLLFRRHYTDAKIKQLAKECLNTPTYCDCNLDYVIEDLQYMSDYEISNFCSTSIEDELRKYALNPTAFLEGGKIAALQKIIQDSQKNDKRILLFSQFVMILDILEKALEHLGVKYTRLDGQTKTDERQGLVDEFNDDPDITVFLLSTKAGGVGINLTAASVVVIYDQDFNPHNDRQAADRAYRIGQEREVEVIKLITKGSIDEDMLAIGMTKLQLDDAVGGEEITLDGQDNSGSDDKTAKEARRSLLTTLRNKFVAVEGDAMEGIKEEKEEGEAKPVPGSVKKARGKGAEV